MDITNKAALWAGSAVSLLGAIVIAPTIGMIRKVNQHEVDITVLKTNDTTQKEDIKEIKESQVRMEGKLDSFIGRFVTPPFPEP